MIKSFNRTLFLLNLVLYSFLLIPSFIGAFALDEGTASTENYIMTLFAQLFTILRFPTHSLFWNLISHGGPIIYFLGLFINGLVYSLILERFITLIKTSFFTNNRYNNGQLEKKVKMNSSELKKSKD